LGGPEQSTGESGFVVVRFYPNAAKKCKKKITDFTIKIVGVAH